MTSGQILKLRDQVVKEIREDGEMSDEAIGAHLVTLVSEIAFQLALGNEGQGQDTENGNA